MLFGPASISRELGPFSGIRFDKPAFDFSPIELGDVQVPAPIKKDERRACPGCPPRNVLRPFLWSLAIDGFYNTINRIRRHGTANVDPQSWWANMKHGFEWDQNDWFTNQFGHPYQGSDYFTAGRAHGLTFWESSAVAAFGSASWEYFAENNRASLNDLINTTLGGVTLGELRHRVAWLIRDPTLEGSQRKKKELIAAAVDPFGYLARKFSGDTTKVSEKPSSLVPSRIGSGGAAGVVFQGTSSRNPDNAARPFIELDLEYGDVRSGASETPYEAFELNFTGGSRRMTHSTIRGRLYSKTAKTHFQISIFQTFDFIINRAYSYGGQGFEVEIAAHAHLSPTTTVWMAATGGANALGAVDTLIEIVDCDYVTRRCYDYGPGGRVGGLIQLIRNGRRAATLGYNGYQISIVDGARSNHVVQRLWVDLRLPLKGAFSVGASGEAFFRKVYVFPEQVKSDRSPQFRAFLAWDLR